MMTGFLWEAKPPTQENQRNQVETENPIHMQGSGSGGIRTGVPRGESQGRQTASSLNLTPT